MSTKITGYRVLIELAEDLAEERQVFGDAVYDFNCTDAIPRDVLFVPIGWDPAIQTAQKLPRDEFRQIDFFVLVLWDRWPAGAKDEYEFALKCLDDGKMPMRCVVPFFKALEPRRLRDPGQALKEVLQFREALEAQKQIRFEPFTTIDSFKTRLRWHLSRWLIDHEERRRVESAEARTLPVPEALREEDKTPPHWQPHPLSDDPDGYNKNGLFLQREGMLDEAEESHKRAIELLEGRGPSEARAIAFGNLGVIYRRQRKFDEAEEMLVKALTDSEQLERPKGVAACFSSLGLLHLRRDDFDRAEQMFRYALGVERELGRGRGMAACYENLASVAIRRGNQEKANEMRRLARIVGEEPEYPDGKLFPGQI